MGPVHPRHPGGTSWHTGGDREHDRLPLLPPGRIHYRGSGTVALTIDHAQYVRAFLDAPELVITVPSVELTKYFARDPHEQDGRLVMERNCRWRALPWPARVSAAFALNLWPAPDTIPGEDREGDERGKRG